MGRAVVRRHGHYGGFDHVGREGHLSNPGAAGHSFRLNGRKGIRRRMGDGRVGRRMPFFHRILRCRCLLLGQPEDYFHDEHAPGLRAAIWGRSLPGNVLDCDPVAASRAGILLDGDRDRNLDAHGLRGNSHLARCEPLFVRPAGR